MNIALLHQIRRVFGSIFANKITVLLAVEGPKIPKQLLAVDWCP